MKQDNLISTITALATPVGQGSVGIVRLSGPLSLNIAKKMLGFEPKPRYAHYTDFLRNDGSVIDKALHCFLMVQTLLPERISLNFKGMAVLLSCTKF